VPGDVGQRLLQHAVDLDADHGIDRDGRPRALIRHAQPQLPFDGRQIGVDRALQSELLENRGVQRLRQAANILERRLRDLVDLAQLGPQRRSVGRVPAGAGQHRSHRGQQLTELVVELTRDLAQRRFAGTHHLPGQGAPLVRERRDPGEDTPVGEDQIDAGGRDGEQRRGEKEIHPLLHLRIDRLDLLRRLLFGRIVPYQQAGDRAAEGRLSRLQRQLDLRACFGLTTGARQLEDPRGGVPELRDRVGEVGSLFRRPPGHGQLGLPFQRRVEVGANAIEL
jgi:hypothetical protein